MLDDHGRGCNLCSCEDMVAEYHSEEKGAMGLSKRMRRKESALYIIQLNRASPAMFHHVNNRSESIRVPMEATHDSPSTITKSRCVTLDLPDGECLRLLGDMPLDANGKEPKSWITLLEATSVRCR